MRKFFAILFAFMLVFTGYGQQLTGVNFENGANLSFFSFLTNQGVLIRVSIDGKLLEWGAEVLSDRGNYYAPKLQPFNVRTEIYNAQSDSAFNGKLKSIGTCFITYYS